MIEIHIFAEKGFSPNSEWFEVLIKLGVRNPRAYREGDGSLLIFIEKQGDIGKINQFIKLLEEGNFLKALTREVGRNSNSYYVKGL